MQFFEKYFTINTNEWTTTVRYSLKIGFYVGIVLGFVLLGMVL